MTTTQRKKNSYSGFGYFLAAGLLIFFSAYFTSGSKSGDASILFSFIKNFFTAPFCFYPGEVTFGASPPLYIVYAAPFHAIFANWMLPLRIANYLLVYLAVVLLSRCVARQKQLSLILLAVSVWVAIPLTVATSAFYGSGLAFFAVSLTFYLAKQQRHIAAIYAAGILHLTRPELALVTLALNIYYLVRYHRRLLLHILIAALPVIAYYAYMFLATGEIIPSSVQGRFLTTHESQASWLHRMVATFQPLLFSPVNIIYSLGGLALLFLIVRDKEPESYTCEIIFVLPIFLLYLLFPPLSYAPRYLIPTLPILIFALVSVIVGAEKPAWPRYFFGLLLLMAAGHTSLYFAHNSNSYLARYDYDTLLLRDMADQLNKIAKPDDKVMGYELQAQYYLNIKLVAANPLVGSTVIPALRGKTTFAEIIRKHRITYITTMNAYNYRRRYKNTILEKLYIHDLTSRVGDRIRLSGLDLEKVLSNPIFSDPGKYQEKHFPGLNFGKNLRLYGNQSKKWCGHHPMWNSVYRVIKFKSRN